MGPRAVRRLSATRRHPRRGNYSALFGLLIFVLMGFGALSIDVSYVRLAQSEAQDVADAASQAGLVMLRQTGDENSARQAATDLAARNVVAGQPPALRELEIGTWVDGAFTASSVDQNAVRAVVGRNVGMLLGPIFDWHTADAVGEAISAAITLHVILVIDITNSWTQADFSQARAAAVAFLDIIEASTGPEDRIGMVVFTGRYGVEHTPLMLVNDATSAGVRDDWAEDLYTASKAGAPDTTHIRGCNTHGNDNFTTPYNGCFPTMWREYTDEAGTDHTTGLAMAQAMFLEHPEVDVYRAVVLLTDGNPNGITSAHTARSDAGYVEDRWRFILTPESRTTAEVMADSATLASAMHSSGDVNIWAVSFVADAGWLGDVAQGDGYYFRASTSAALTPIFEDIAESLPLAIVR